MEGKTMERSPAMKPTQGQRTMLWRIGRVDAVLRAERQADGAVVYRLLERSTGRELQIVAKRMVMGLFVAGWIEPVGAITADMQVWTYRITEAGIAAAHRPPDE
jgi:hypothetical protein